MRWSDGTVSRFKRRQAPDLYLDSNGFPLHRLISVDELSDDNCPWGPSETLIYRQEWECSYITCERTMRSFLVFVFFQIVLAASPVGAANTKNVLFIVVDDLRPDLSAYGQEYVHTPNIDKLAKESLVFERAYCQQAVCGPSRNSFMTGRRPDTTKAWNFIDHFRELNVGLNWSSLPQYFKKHGYFSSGVGKLYHPNLPPNYDPPSWSDFDKFPFVYP